jgi:hypothetical protein
MLNSFHLKHSEDCNLNLITVGKLNTEVNSYVLFWQTTILNEQNVSFPWLYLTVEKKVFFAKSGSSFGDVNKPFANMYLLRTNGETFLSSMRYKTIFILALAAHACRGVFLNNLTKGVWLWIKYTTNSLKGNFVIFYMLVKYVPGDIKYIFTKFYQHISTNKEVNRTFVISVSLSIIFFSTLAVKQNERNCKRDPIYNKYKSIRL